MDYIDKLKSNTSKIFTHSKKIREFLEKLLDSHSFVETDVFLSGAEFTDGTDGLGEGVVTGYGTINEHPVCIAAQNSEVLGGSLGKAHAAKIIRCIERAIKTDSTLLLILDSRGAKLLEGMGVLDGYAAVINAAYKAKNNIPTIAIVKGNAIGLNGMLAASCDFVFMSDDCTISAQAPLAISPAVNESSKKFAGKDILASKSLIPSFTFSSGDSLRLTISELFEYVDESFVGNNDDQNRVCEEFNDKIYAEKLSLELADDYSRLELYAGFAPEVKTVLTAINSIPAGLVITSGGKLNANSLKKITKFIKLLNAYNLPVISLVDCEGLEATLIEEQAGFILEANALLEAVNSTDSVKIAVITGKAIGYAYTALASKASGFDYVLAVANAVISPVTEDAAVSIFFSEDISAKDILSSREDLKKKYALEQANPFVSAKAGLVDNVIESALIRPYVASALAMLVK